MVFTHTGNPYYAGRLATMLERLRQDGFAVEAVEADACRSADTQRTARRVVDRYGRLDVLVANVGQNKARPVEETTDEDWRRFVDVNLSSAFYGVRAALPPMLKKGRGKILLIGSSAAFDGGGGAVDYAAAKAGLTGMMRYLARSYARQGVLANVIHPAVIETDLLRERYSHPDKKQALIAQVPVGRLGRPEDIAGLAAFLASSWGDFICGQEFLVDGGRTFFRPT